MIRVVFSLLGQMFLGIQPKAQCGVCGKGFRDIGAHMAQTQCGGGYWR